MTKNSNKAFRALADATRRDILSLLRSGPLTSGELAAQFNSSWPTVSRHLAVLRDADLVAAERHGQEIRYQLNTSVFQDLGAAPAGVDPSQERCAAPNPKGGAHPPTGGVMAMPRLVTRSAILAGYARGAGALYWRLPAEIPPSWTGPSGD